MFFYNKEFICRKKKDKHSKGIRCFKVNEKKIFFVSILFKQILNFY